MSSASKGHGTHHQHHHHRHHHHEEEAAEPAEPNPFHEKSEGWHRKRNLLNMIQSHRHLRRVVAAPNPNARQFRRNRSLPQLPLLVKHDEETLEFPETEPSYFPMAHQPEVVVRRKGRLSMIASGSEETARQLFATLEPLARQETTNEDRVPGKFQHWGIEAGVFELDLAQKSLMSDDFYFLGHALRFNVQVRKLDLSRCFVADEDLKELTSSLDFNICLETLVLHKTRVTDEGAALLADLMSRNHTLTSLDVRQAMLTAEGGKSLVAASERNPNLKMINGIDVHALREAVPDELDFQECTFGGPEVVLLSHLVKGRANVTSLNLRKNMLGPKSVPALMAMIAALPALATVVLRENRIGCQGAEALADLLEHNVSLRRVDVSKNGLMLVLPKKTRDTKGGQDLVDALGVNRTLQFLDHGENDMDEAIARQIDERCMVNRALTHTPPTFVEHLDTLMPPQMTAKAAGGYELGLDVDLDFLRFNTSHMELSFVGPLTVKPKHDADSFLLHPKTRTVLAMTKQDHQKSSAALSVSSVNTGLVSAAPTYTVDCAVMCRWHVDGRLYPATITAENADGSFNVRFQDGAVVTAVHRADLRLGHRSAEARFDP